MYHPGTEDNTPPAVIFPHIFHGADGDASVEMVLGSAGFCSLPFFLLS